MPDLVGSKQAIQGQRSLAGWTLLNLSMDATVECSMIISMVMSYVPVMGWVIVTSSCLVFCVKHYFSICILTYSSL